MVIALIIKINKFIAFLLVLLLAYFAVIGIVIDRESKTVVGTLPSDNDIVIIIDPGHGGEDGGAKASDGTIEKDLNLSIALCLRDICEMAGYAVYMTRDTDRSLCDDAFNKNEDMHNRIELANKYPNSVLISIHLNKFSIEKYNGAQVFYSTNHDGSEILAQAIQSSIARNLQPTNTRQIKKGNDNSILLRLAESPAVIVEGGFLSNTNELELLKTEEYRFKLAYCIFLGLLEYQGSDVK